MNPFRSALIPAGLLWHIIWRVCSRYCTYFQPTCTIAEDEDITSARWKWPVQCTIYFVFLYHLCHLSSPFTNACSRVFVTCIVIYRYLCEGSTKLLFFIQSRPFFGFYDAFILSCRVFNVHDIKCAFTTFQLNVEQASPLCAQYASSKLHST